MSDPSQCPSTLTPHCSSGLKFCGDGTCQISCDNIPNACLCNGDDNGYKPCAAGQKVNITHYNPQEKDSQIQSTCAKDANIVNPIGVWGVFDSSQVWLECPTVVAGFTFREPMWIAVWSLSAFEALLLVSWHLYKKARESWIHRKAETFSSYTVDEKISMTGDAEDTEAKERLGTPSSSETSTLEDSEQLQFKGFHRDFFGIFAFGSVVVTTLLFMVFLGCLVSDYCK